MISITESRSLTEMINALERKSTEPIVTQKVFGRKRNETSDVIDIEIRTGTGNLAAIVGDADDAAAVNKAVRAVKTYKLPRIYEKKIFTASELGRFTDVGLIYGSVDDKERAKAKLLADELLDLKDRVLRRREQIACSILTTGKFTYDAGGVTYSADFGFESGKHLITLASGEKWDATGVKIVNQILKWRRAIAQRSGYNADLLLLGTDAADLFLANEEVRKIFDTNNYRVGAAELTGKVGVGGTYLGTFLGMEVYEVSQLYNNDGADAEMFDKTKAVVIASNADSLITHVAPIYRTDGNIVAEFYVQSVETGDKTRVEWLIESKAMPAVHEPDVLVSVKVM